MISWNINNDINEGVTENFKQKNKLAIFSLYGVLINHNFSLIYQNTKDKLQKLNNDNYAIVIYFNLPCPDNNIQNKIEDLIKLLSVETKIFYTDHFNKYTKPYNELIKKLPFPSYTFSFICGNDNIDYKFAYNCNLKYIIPDYFFLDKPNLIPKISYPITFSEKHSELFIKITPQIKDMIILVGYQASGKSIVAKYLAKKYGYYILSVDDYVLNKQILSMNKIENIINQHNKIIIDYFCIKPIRKKFIDIGKKYDYYIRTIVFDYDLDLIKHNSYYRYLKEGREIANIFYNTKLDLTINKEEGIDEIIKFKPFYQNDQEYYKYMY